MAIPVRSDKRKDKRKKIVESRHLRWKGVMLVALTAVIVFHFQIEDVFLRKYGVCTEGVVSSEVHHIRGDKDTFYYVFTIDGKQYHANANIWADRMDRVGTKVCIVYLSILPEISRSIENYFESDFQKCSCTR